MNKERIVNRNLLSIISAAGGVLAVLCLFMPMVLFFFTDRFSGKTVFTVCLLILGTERLWFSLFTSKNKRPFTVSEDWTFVAVGLSFTLMMYSTIFELYFGNIKTISLSSSISGFILIAVSLSFRYWAVKSLGSQWAIHLESSDNENRFLITSGPFAFIRHPIYFAAMIEVFGIPLFFNSYKTLIFSLLVCVPLQVKRTYFEEKQSILLFGEKYIEYKKRTWAFWPIKKQ